MQNGVGKLNRARADGGEPAATRNQLRDRANSLQQFRKKLPVWPQLPKIRQTLRGKDVLLIVGETGSGKSTQVPQSLVAEPWCQSRSVTVRPSDGGQKEKILVGGCIAVTEPRRVAAISLARRVAAEMGTPLGSSSPASKVGYSVRFDNSTSPSTRIKFLTEGMLLQELLRDPWLRQYSAVIVDEIHERGVNADLVIGFLRNLVAGNLDGRGKVPLKVVVMSATVDLNELLRFFKQGYPQNEDLASDGRAHDIRNSGEKSGGHNRPDDDASESSWSGFSDSEDILAKVTQGVKGIANPDHAQVSSDGHEKIGICTVKGRQYPVAIFYELEPVTDLIESALHKVFQVHCGEPLPGDILVFLSGQEDIEALGNLINDSVTQLPAGTPKVSVIPLFAALPQVDQQKVFQPLPVANARKVILSTNIAETSVTVPGIKYVIDSGKVKIKQFRSRLGLDSLLAKPISKSSAIQRQGRAGREAPGKCYRLYTERDFQKLDQTNVPEILRCDLAHTVLIIKARGVEDVVSFPFLNPPPREVLEKALLQLYTLGALSGNGTINELGKKMAHLPLTPTLGRVLLAAAAPDVDCLREVIDIISCLTVENIFLNVISEEQKEEAEEARKSLVRREGDHLTLLTAVQKYSQENTDRKEWAKRHFVSHRAMQSVMDVRKQLLAICRAQNLLHSAPDDSSPVTATPERGIAILKCFLTGFAGSTARLSPDGSYRTVVNNHKIAIHPSSTLYGKKVEAIMYNEYVFTNKNYARCVSVVQMDWIGQALGVSV